MPRSRLVRIVGKIVGYVLVSLVGMLIFFLLGLMNTSGFEEIYAREPDPRYELFKAFCGHLQALDYVRPIMKSSILAVSSLIAYRMFRKGFPVVIAPYFPGICLGLYGNFLFDNLPTESMPMSTVYEWARTDWLWDILPIAVGALGGALINRRLANRLHSVALVERR